VRRDKREKTGTINFIPLEPICEDGGKSIYG